MQRYGHCSCDMIYSADLVAPARVRSPDCLALETYSNMPSSSVWSANAALGTSFNFPSSTDPPSPSGLRDPSDQIKFLVHTKYSKIPTRHFSNITTTCLFVWRTRKRSRATGHATSVPWRRSVKAATSLAHVAVPSFVSQVRNHTD